MRAFVAIELDDACRRGLREAVDALAPMAGGVRWVAPESMHLTLKFIGDLADADVLAAVEALAGAGADVPSFGMEVGGLSAFPSRGAPRVIHVGVAEASGALHALQESVERALAAAIGLAPERRAYVPHVTLGRVKDRRRCPSATEIAVALGGRGEFGRVAVAHYVLMQSELRPTGAVYTVVQRFPLGGDVP